MRLALLCAVALAAPIATAHASSTGVYVPSSGITLRAPQRTVLTSGSGTYTTPPGALWLEVDVQGGGGSGSGSGKSGGGANVQGVAGVAGNASTFGALTASGGAAGALGTSYSTTLAAGGMASGGDLNLSGSPGGVAFPGSYVSGGSGGASGYGAPPKQISSEAGQSGPANSGSGGSGAGSDSGDTPGLGAGAGGRIVKLIPTPAASYSYGVAADVAGGAGGTGGYAGGTGRGGVIIVTAHFQ